jgi:hypothetical protein
MRHFADPAAFAAHLRAVAKAVPKAFAAEAKLLGSDLVKEARAMYGTYQPGWQELAPRTQAQRVKLGYSPNDPLLRSGALRDAVTFKVKPGHLFVGVPEGAIAMEGAKALDLVLIGWTLEKGSIQKNIPARPIYGRLMFRAHKYAHRLAFGTLKRAGL